MKIRITKNGKYKYVSICTAKKEIIIIYCGGINFYKNIIYSSEKQPH